MIIDAQAGAAIRDDARPDGARRGGRIITGKLSGKSIALPSAAAPLPALAAPGVISNGEQARDFGTIGASRAYPDVRSFKRKFGLIVPATNTTMEHELWSLLFKNHDDALRGVGLHASRVVTPNPRLATREDLAKYQQQFLAGLKSAIDAVSLAEPDYLIMGMSLEHILDGVDAIRAPMADLEAYSGRSWATWHEAADAALKCYRARRIGLLTPFDTTGNERATRLFEDLGFEVVASVGFSCADARHIAHIPDWAKERAILELLATPGDALDAIVQCGTNMSLLDVTERLEPLVGIPILGINAVTFWYALRENGLDGPLIGGGRLLREF